MLILASSPAALASTSPPHDLVQIVSILAALLQLVAYALMQLRRLQADTYTYQLCNVVGSFLMTNVAIINREYGFILMEGVWFLTSAYGLLRLLRSRRQLF